MEFNFCWNRANILISHDRRLISVCFNMVQRSVLQWEVLHGNIFPQWSMPGAKQLLKYYLREENMCNLDLVIISERLFMTRPSVLLCLHFIFPLMQDSIIYNMFKVYCHIWFMSIEPCLLTIMTSEEGMMRQRNFCHGGLKNSKLKL